MTQDVTRYLQHNLQRFLFTIADYSRKTATIHNIRKLKKIHVLPGTTSGGTINEIHETTTNKPLGRYV